MPLQSSLVVSDKALAKLKALPSGLKEELRKSVTRLAIKLQRYIMESKLSGQVLHVRTGNLRSSITQNVEETQGSIVATVGTNVWYGRVHEYGFKGTANVPESLRTIKQAWGKSITPVTVTVKAHTRRVNLPERSFLRSALADMAPEIREAMETDIRKAAKELWQ